MTVFSLDNLDNIGSWMSTVSSLIKVKDLIQKFVPKEGKVHKAFRFAIHATAERLEHKYDKDLLGGSTEDILLNQIDPIFKSFEPYGHFKSLKSTLSEEIHFDTLPSGFYEDFKSILIEELLEYRETRQALYEYLRSIQIDQIHDNTSQIPELSNKLETLDTKLGQVLTRLKGEELKYQSVKYKPAITSFVERKIQACSAKQSKELQMSYPYDLIENRSFKRIALLNYAGNGKSEELRNLAFKLSSEEVLFEPILLNLGIIDFENHRLEGYLDNGYPGWRNLKGNLVLILDALDEVGFELLDKVKKQILSLATLMPHCTIVVSCRTNVYNLDRVADIGYLDSFNHFELPPFSDQDIWTYVINRLEDIEKAEVMLQQIRKLGFWQDISTPFYLVRLSDYYQENSSLPTNKKELFEWLINQLKLIEKNKSVKLKDDIEDNEEALDLVISKVACILQITDVNYLSSQGLNEIVRNSKLVKLLKSCYLLDNGAENKWRFEHNNFKEYLSAKFMSQKGVDFIKSVILLPGINKIKPGWLNTLGFLISYLDKGSDTLIELIDYLIKYDADSLIRVEIDKIDLSKREKVFYDLFHSALEKGIYPRTVKFDTQNLGDFVSDSKEVCHFLINQIDENNSKLHIDVSLYLLRWNKHIVSGTKAVENKIRYIIFNSSDHTKKKVCIEALKWFDIYDLALRKELFTKLDMPEREEALFHYLAHTNYVEDHLEFMFNQVLLKQSYRDYKYSVAIYLNDPKSFEFILGQLIEDVGGYHYDDILADTLKVLKEKSFYTDSLTDNVYRCFKLYSKRFSDTNLKKALAHYAEDVDLNRSMFEKAINEFFHDVDNNSINCIHALFNKQNLPYLLTRLKSEVPSLKHGKILRNILQHSETAVFEEFYLKLNEIYNNELLWIEMDPYEEAKKIQVDFYFDRSDFLKCSNQFFSREILTRDALYSSENYDNEDPKHIACRNILGDIIDLVITRSDFIKLIEDDLEWEFIIARALHQMVSDARIVFDKRENNFLKNWAKKTVQNIDFHPTYFKDEKGEWRYYSIALYAASICEYYNLQMNSTEYKRLLSMDTFHIPYIKSENSKNESYFENKKLHNSPLINYLVSKIGADSVEREIIRTLTKEVYKDVRINHLKFLRIEEKRQFLDHFLIHEDQEKTNPTQLVWYLELGGDVSIAFDFLKDISNDNYSQWSLVGAILQKDSIYLIDYLKEKLSQANDSDEEELIISYLLKCDIEYGINLVKEWITKHKSFPRHSWIDSILKSNSNKRLVALKEIYLDSIIYRYGGDQATFDRRSCLKALLSIAKKDPNSYNDISSFLKDILNENPEMKFLYGVLDELEYDFYMENSKFLNLNQVLQLIDE